MLHSLARLADQKLGFPAADAHCDIPCKIYDPAAALVAALSVVRMMDILDETYQKDDSLEKLNTLTRCIAVKEEEAEKVKSEVRTIWGDYFKPPHFEQHPCISDLAHEIMMVAGRCKQGVSREEAITLVDLVNRFAEIFWKTKGVETERKEAPFPPALDIVRPV